MMDDAMHAGDAKQGAENCISSRGLCKEGLNMRTCVRTCGARVRACGARARASGERVGRARVCARVN